MLKTEIKLFLSELREKVLCAWQLPAMCPRIWSHDGVCESKYTWQTWLSDHVRFVTIMQKLVRAEEYFTMITNAVLYLSHGCLNVSTQFAFRRIYETDGSLRPWRGDRFEYRVFLIVDSRDWRSSFNDYRNGDECFQYRVGGIKYVINYFLRL